MPTEPINLDALIKVTSQDPKTIKNILYLMVATGHIKATFRPHCKTCKNPLAPSYASSYDAEAAVEAGYCSQCEQFVAPKVGYDVVMEFWGLGTVTGAKGE
jgi:hypothetical protein